MAGHRRHEKAVHGPLGGLEQISGFPSVEPTAPCRQGELLVERSAKAKESLNSLAERQLEGRGQAAILGGIGGGLRKVMCSGFDVRRIEVLDKATSQKTAALPEEATLLLVERQDPRDVARDRPACSTVRSRDPGWRQACASQRRTRRPVGRE
jgi:hypothetical protein